MIRIALLAGLALSLVGCVSLPTAAWTAVAAGAGACAAACPPLLALEKDMFDWATGQSTPTTSKPPATPAK